MDIAPLGLYAEVQCPRCFRTERVHAQLGNFRLDAVLGVGGMSVVYRAFDVVLHRALALKVLNDTFRDQPERIERFENESAMMARVRHENVTSVYSAGRAYGQFYIAMELIEGVNLEYMVTAEKTMPAEQALDIIRQVASGLQSANEAGLLHRDMKPGNVLITPEGRAKVIDFGLAMDSREDEMEEIIWATPYYVPPETLQRKPEDVRTDIYALGMTLRFLLTGVERFSADTSSLQALIQCKRKMMPLAKEHPEIPTPLAELVDHMTEFAAVDRPSSYGELIEEIDEVRSELATYVAPNTAEGRRRRLLTKMGVLTGGLLVGALVGSILAPSEKLSRQEYLSLPEETHEAQINLTLSKALDLIRSKNYAAAVKTLLEASAGEGDPCMGAWYAQLARILLASCRNDPSEAQRAHELLLRHLGNERSVQPAGRRGFRMIAMMDSRPYPGAQDWARHSGNWNSISKNDITKAMNDLEKSDVHPVIKAMEWYVLSEKAIWLGYTGLSEHCLSRVKGMTSLGGYEPLSEILSSPSIYGKTTGTDKGDFSSVEASMRGHDFAAATGQLAAMLKDARLDVESKAKAKVFQEVCEVAQTMFDVLKRSGCSTNVPDANLLNSARGMSLRPSSRPAAWADCWEGGHPAKDAIDGNPATRWCAANANPGHVFVLDILNVGKVSHILIQWEQARKSEVIAKLYSEGKVYKQPFTKDKLITRLEVGNKPLERLELIVNGTSLDNYASIAEITLVDEKGQKMELATKVGNDDFADQLRVVLLIVAGKYEEAFNMLDYVVARQGSQEPFCIIAEDWKRRWYSKAVQ